MNKKYKLGCKRDKKDNRDYLMRAYLPVSKIPAKVDYASAMTPVRDQGDEGTCVAFSTVAGMKEYQEQVDWKKYMELSPRFLYSECKKIDGYPNSEGTNIRFAMKVLKVLGTCMESFWPYQPHQDDKPKSGAKADATKFRELSYARILDLNELRMSIAQKGPCVIGVEVYQGMMDTKTGKVPMPKTGEQTLGGHAICAVGYDDAKKLIKFKNSWTAQWGDKGYGYLPYAYIQKYMMDAWSSVDIIDADPMTVEKVLKFAQRQLR
jgi:C1A family cysteine protease